MPITTLRRRLLATAAAALIPAAAVAQGDVQLNTFTLQTTTGQELGSTSGSGDMQSLMQTQKQMVYQLLGQIGVDVESLPPDVRSEIARPATQSVQALEAFSQGLDALDNEDYAGAKQHFNRAAQLDPGFGLAKEMGAAMPEVKQNAMQVLEQQSGKAKEKAAKVAKKVATKLAAAEKKSEKATEKAEKKSEKAAEKAEKKGEKGAEKAEKEAEGEKSGKSGGSATAGQEGKGGEEGPTEGDAGAPEMEGPEPGEGTGDGLFEIGDQEAEFVAGLDEAGREGGFAMDTMSSMAPEGDFEVGRQEPDGTGLEWIEAPFGDEREQRDTEFNEVENHTEVAENINELSSTTSTEESVQEETDTTSNAITTPTGFHFPRLLDVDIPNIPIGSEVLPDDSNGDGSTDQLFISFLVGRSLSTSPYFTKKPLADDGTTVTIPQLEGDGYITVTDGDQLHVSAVREHNSGYQASGLYAPLYFPDIDLNQVFGSGGALTRPNEVQVNSRYWSNRNQRYETSAVAGDFGTFTEHWPEGTPQIAGGLGYYASVRPPTSEFLQELGNRNTVYHYAPATFDTTLFGIGTVIRIEDGKASVFPISVDNHHTIDFGAQEVVESHLGAEAHLAEERTVRLDISADNHAENGAAPPLPLGDDGAFHYDQERADWATLTYGHYDADTQTWVEEIFAEHSQFDSINVAGMVGGSDAKGLLGAFEARATTAGGVFWFWNGVFAGVAQQEWSRYSAIGWDNFEPQDRVYTAHYQRMPDGGVVGVVDEWADWGGRQIYIADNQMQTNSSNHWSANDYFWARLLLDPEGNGGNRAILYAYGLGYNDSNQNRWLEYRDHNVAVEPTLSSRSDITATNGEHLGSWQTYNYTLPAPDDYASAPGFPLALVDNRGYLLEVDATPTEVLNQLHANNAIYQYSAHPLIQGSVYHAFNGVEKVEAVTGGGVSGIVNFGTQIANFSLSGQTASYSFNASTGPASIQGDGFTLNEFHAGSGGSNATAAIGPLNMPQTTDAVQISGTIAGSQAQAVMGSYDIERKGSDGNYAAYGIYSVQH